MTICREYKKPNQEDFARATSIARENLLKFKGVVNGTLDVRSDHSGGESKVCSSAKHDEGKIRPSLVPTSLIRAVAKVREYGVEKYGDPDNWKSVESCRYIDACYRHWLRFIDDPEGKDEESGLPHIWHVACNIAFLCENFDRGKRR